MGWGGEAAFFDEGESGAEFEGHGESLFAGVGPQDDRLSGGPFEVAFGFDVEILNGGVGEFQIGGRTPEVELVNAEAVGTHDDGVAADVEEGVEEERAGDEADQRDEVARGVDDEGFGLRESLRAGGAAFGADADQREEFAGDEGEVLPAGDDSEEREEEAEGDEREIPLRRDGEEDGISDVSGGGVGEESGGEGHRDRIRGLSEVVECFLILTGVVGLVLACRQCFLGT